MKSDDKKYDVKEPPYDSFYTGLTRLIIDSDLSEEEVKSLFGIGDASVSYQ